MRDAARGRTPLRGRAGPVDITSWCASRPGVPESARSRIDAYRNPRAWLPHAIVDQSPDLSDDAHAPQPIRPRDLGSSPRPSRWQGSLSPPAWDHPDVTAGPGAVPSVEGGAAGRPGSPAEEVASVVATRR